MKLGFNIDGVIAEQDLAALLKASDDLQRTSKVIEYFASRKPLLNSLHFVNPVYDEIYVITSREDCAKEITVQWCSKHLPNYIKLFFACVPKWKKQSELPDWFRQVAIEKAIIINNLQLDIYFEDIPKVVMKLREMCPATKIINYRGNDCGI
jgi:hypothetical protein